MPVVQIQRKIKEWHRPWSRRAAFQGKISILPGQIQEGDLLRQVGNLRDTRLCVLRVLYEWGEERTRNLGVKVT